MFLGEKQFLTSFCFVLSACASGAGAKELLFVLSCVAVSNIICVIHKKTGKPISLWQASLYAGVTGLLNCYFSFSTFSGLYLGVINSCLNVLFMLCAINIFKVLRNRKFNLNLNVDETICGCLVLCLCFCALQNLNFFGFDFVKLFGLLLILLTLNVLKGASSVVAGVIAGLGAFLCAGDFAYITLLAVVSVFCYAFKNQSRILVVLAMVTIDVALSFMVGIFGEVGVLSLAVDAICGAIYLLIPKSVLEKLKLSIFMNEKSVALKNLLNNNKQQLGKRLRYTSEVFYEMDRNFRKLVKGSVDAKSAKTMLCQEVVRANCGECPERTRCLKGFGGEHKKVFENLISAGFEKGKVTLVDLPSFLTSRCHKLNQVVGSVNSALKEYKNFTTVMSNLDSSKLLVAEQLKGISKVLDDLASATTDQVNLDHKLEKQIQENLTYSDIVPLDLVCFEKDEKTNVVSMALRTVDFDNKKILQVLNNLLPSKMTLGEVVPSADANVIYITYKTAPAYDFTVGIAQQTKGGEEKCGDTHSFVKLDNGKFIFALCDGMGSGEKAKTKSEMSIDLIENFYKAGFDEDTILNSVNALLNLQQDGVFSALDLSVVDLKNGETDFIKQGACVGFVKNKETVNKVLSSSLPLGVLSNIKPSITKTVLSTDDIVVMVSDGVVDAFGEEELSTFIGSLPQGNPQDIADTILEKAKALQNNYPKDDMTVVAGKLFYNCA